MKWVNIGNGGEKNIKEGKARQHCLFHVTCKRGMDVAGYYSPCQLREGDGRGRQNNKLIEKGCREKILVTGGGIKTTDKLTTAGFSVTFFNKGQWQRAVISLWTEGGPSTPAAELQFNWKWLWWENIGSGGEKHETTDKTHRRRLLDMIRERGMVVTGCYTSYGVREGGWWQWLGNPIVYLLPLGSSGGNENDTTWDTCLACLHQFSIRILGYHLCGYG